jgi:predicted metal-dependent peptidase
MSINQQLVDDEISRSILDLLLKEPFYAHVLAGMPREITEHVKSIGLFWNGQQVVLRVNPEWFLKSLPANQRQSVLKHEILHVVFRHIFRPCDRDPFIFSIAADLVVNQLLAPLKPLRGWPLLRSFPELELIPDCGVDDYYTALKGLLNKMTAAGFGSESEERWAPGSGMPESAKALAELIRKMNRNADDSGWHDGRNSISASAGRYAVGSLLIRARERMPPHNWGSLPSHLISELNSILSERQPKLDWKRVLRIFCASSGRTKIRHTIKRVSKRYGTRPGIKVQRLQRLLVAVDTSGSIDQEMIDAFFAEIHAVWRAGASVHVVECDAEVQRDYAYMGLPPKEISGGGGTDFEPVFRWMRDQRPFDGMLYLTDGYGPTPGTRPRCKMLWALTGDSQATEGSTLPFGPSIQLKVD